MKMKVIIFSQQEAAKRLVVWLIGQGVDVTVISDMPDSTAALQQDCNFDIGIVDDFSEGAVSACHLIKKEWDIPLILMVNKQHSNWKKMWLLNADGYLSGDIGDYELKARLGSLLRRFSPRKTAKMKGIIGRKRMFETGHPFAEEDTAMPNLTTSEVADLLGIHISTVRRWSKSGVLPSYSNGERKSRIFKRKDISTFLGIYSRNRMLK
jgi:excisionase family DNA binding protein